LDPSRYLHSTLPTLRSISKTSTQVPIASRNRTRGFCADFAELVYASIVSSISASHQEADQLTLVVQLLINSETALALVVFDMREKLVDADSAESWAQR
jgi:hypothetical protein